jgi:hypothetical protein
MLARMSFPRRPNVVATLAVTAVLACSHKQSPTAVSSPVPSPAATATPAPAATPRLPGANSCARLPLVTHDVGNCPTEGPTFMPQVLTAINQVHSQQPEIFQDAGGNTLVVSPGRFLVGVIDNLDKMGLCAGFDSEEIQVTNDASFNDQYHLLTSRGFLRTDPSIYRATCHPAALPTPPPPFHTANPGCKLPSSLEVTCDREPQIAYVADLEASLDEVMRQHPEAFDNPQAYTPRVNDGYLDVYHQWFVDAMVKRGYCAWWDSEEVQVKKENRFSEHYKIFLSDGHVRRGVDSYRSTCWPAAF